MANPDTQRILFRLKETLCTPFVKDPPKIKALYATALFFQAASTGAWWDEGEADAGANWWSCGGPWWGPMRLMVEAMFGLEDMDKRTFCAVMDRLVHAMVDPKAKKQPMLWRVHEWGTGDKKGVLLDNVHPRGASKMAHMMHDALFARDEDWPNMFKLGKPGLSRSDQRLNKFFFGFKWSAESLSDLEVCACSCFVFACFFWIGACGTNVYLFCIGSLRRRRKERLEAPSWQQEGGFETEAELRGRGDRRRRVL